MKPGIAKLGWALLLFLLAGMAFGQARSVHMFSKGSHGHSVLTCESEDGSWDKSSHCKIEQGYDLDYVVHSFVAIIEHDEDPEVPNAPSFPHGRRMIKQLKFTLLRPKELR